LRKSGDPVIGRSGGAVGFSPVCCHQHEINPNFSTKRAISGDCKRQIGATTLRQFSPIYMIFHIDRKLFYFQLVLSFGRRKMAFPALLSISSQLWTECPTRDIMAQRPSYNLLACLFVHRRTSWQRPFRTPAGFAHPFIVA
jgi:hypothetical protein